MGMFDYVRIAFPLPDEIVQHVEFQTKDLDCLLDEYRITKDGKLELLVYDTVPVPDSDAIFGYHMERFNERWQPWDFHGDLVIYTYGLDGRFYEYVVHFVEGEVAWVKRLPED